MLGGPWATLAYVNSCRVGVVVPAGAACVLPAHLPPESLGWFPWVPRQAGALHPHRPSRPLLAPSPPMSKSRSRRSCLWRALGAQGPGGGRGGTCECARSSAYVSVVVSPVCTIHPIYTHTHQHTLTLTVWTRYVHSCTGTLTKHSCYVKWYDNVAAECHSVD